MRILFAGTPNVAIPTLQFLLHSNHEIVGVLTRAPAAQGRSDVLVDTPVAALAEANGIKIFTTQNSAEFVEILATVDLVVVIAYGHLIPEALLKLPTFGWINIHFSQLPKLRGAAPIQRAIWEGNESTGISIFQLDKGMDTGPIFLMEEVSILENETAGECLERVSLIAPTILNKAIELIATGFTPIPQKSDGSSLAPKITKSEMRIDWEGKAIKICNQVRALSPTPRARTTFQGSDLYIYRVGLSQDISVEPAGTISLINSKLMVATGDLDLEILEIQSAGRKNLTGIEWARGIKSIGGLKKERYV